MKRALILSLFLTTSACSDPGAVDFRITPLTSPPVPVVVAKTGLVIPEGIAVGLEIVGVDDEGEDTPVDAKITTPFDETRIAYLTTVNSEDRVFILQGVSVGATTVTISNGGIFSLPVEVVEQPPP